MVNRLITGTMYFSNTALHERRNTIAINPNALNKIARPRYIDMYLSLRSWPHSHPFVYRSFTHLNAAVRKRILARYKNPISLDNINIGYEKNPA